MSKYLTNKDSWNINWELDSPCAPHPWQLLDYDEREIVIKWEAMTAAASIWCDSRKRYISVSSTENYIEYISGSNKYSAEERDLLSRAAYRPPALIKSDRCAFAEQERSIIENFLVDKDLRLYPELIYRAQYIWPLDEKTPHPNKNLKFISYDGWSDIEKQEIKARGIFRE